MQGSWVISGSDDGTVRLYDQRSAEVIKCLHHADGALNLALVFYSAYGLLPSQYTCSSRGGASFLLYLYPKSNNVHYAGSL
jgi:WD40 repeat protein